MVNGITIAGRTYKTKLSTVPLVIVIHTIQDKPAVLNIHGIEPKPPTSNLHISHKVPQPKPQIAPKPSETSLFPPLPPSQGLTYARAGAPTPDATQTPTPPTEQPTEKTITNPTNTTKNTSPDGRTEQLVEVVLRASMQKMEAYIDQKLNEMEDRMVTFAISPLTTHAKPTKRQRTLMTANQTARRLLNKRVAHHFIDNQIQLSLMPFLNRRIATTQN
ncbi:hypothetical protein ANN_26043 [Periplaneta americana]|uniref:Uncharacterized protein n=1 Tax=Periplaneta americana TaxID=6978 RepID=A0ABQ8S585_PERAM|nr:hypothetical protein ANN_26043 [Periplaneta americana]